MIRPKLNKPNKFGNAIKPTKLLLNFLLIPVILAPMLMMGHTNAQGDDNSGVSITTSPLPTSVRTNPGQSVKTELQVQNSGKKPTLLRVSLLKFTANNDEGQPKLADRGRDDDYFDWVHFSEDTFMAEPGVWKKITMTIDVPASAGLGYYYAVVFSKADAPKPTNQQTAIEGAAAILVLLDVKSPNEKRTMDLVSFSSDHKTYEFLPATFKTRLKNTGNIFLAPSGTIFISRGSKQIATIDLNPGHGNILPGTERVYTAKWEDGFPSYKEKLVNGKPVGGKNENAKQLTWDFNSPLSKFRFGKYTAKIVAVYDDGQRDIPLTSTVTFWIIPWRFIFGLLVLLALIGFLIYRNIQNRKRIKLILAGHPDPKKSKSKKSKRYSFRSQKDEKPKEVAKESDETEKKEN